MTKTALGIFLDSLKFSKADISRNTGLTTGRLNTLSNDIDSKLYADEFYLIVNAINFNFDKACGIVFKKYKLDTSSEQKWTTDLGKYLFDYAKPTGYLIDTTGLKSSRLSKLLTEHGKRPYAYEVYLLALAIEKKPSEVFEFLYGPEGIGK